MIDPRLFATVFGSVFLAELGDKTQLATLLFAADPARSRLTVFAASATALVVSSALGVLAGASVGALVDPRLLRWAAGLGFIVVGAKILLQGD
jgi:putative Ca2+/H+ antiporter (TMEM165/GDT1 family)